MQVIEAEYEIVTPMFIGGADPGDSPEIRPPSVKGALRFWWRALQWGQCLQDKGNNVEEALHELHRQEAELFGEAVNESGGGQGKILLKVKELPLRLMGANKPSSGKIYLLGKGLYTLGSKKNNQPARFLHLALDRNQKFKVILKLANDVDIKSIADTLLIFGLLGGLGSRSRRGWGSIAICSLRIRANNKPENIPTDKESYKQAIKKILTCLPSEIPIFTAFTKQTRIDISKSSSEVENLLTLLGNEMQMYRSYKKVDTSQEFSQVNNGRAKKRFDSDHDNVRQFAKNGNISVAPQRAIFGLPHNYFFSSLNPKDGGVDTNKVDVNAENFNRRSSPLMIHIHKFPSGKCVAVQSLLKADFLPKSEKIQLQQIHDKTKTAVGKDKKLEFKNVDWQDITTYLDRENFDKDGRIL